MHQKVGKKINPSSFQKSVLSDLRQYQHSLEARAKTALPNATVEVKQCCLCGKANTSPLVTVYGFTYVQCQSCSHVFLNKRLSAEEMTAFYTHSQDYAQAYTDQAQLTYRLKHIATPKVKWVMKQLPITNQERTWLDVGCAIGDVIKAVEKNAHWSGIGLDVSAPSVALGRKMYQVDLRQTELKDFSHHFPNQTFDVISFFGYLGLVSDPMADLILARKHLKPGGFLVVGEENAASYSTLIQQAFPEFSSRHLLPPMTTHQFTPKSLRTALATLNFEPIASWNFGLDFYEFLKMISLTHPSFRESTLFTKMLEQLNAFQKVIDTQEMGDYLMVISQYRG